MTAVVPVEMGRMAGQYPLHHFACRGVAGFQQKMSMIGNERPGIAYSSGLLKHLTESIQEVVMIFIVTESFPWFKPLEYAVMKCSRSVAS